MADNSRVLIVEDDPNTAFLISRFLQKDGFDSEVVSSAEDALDKAKSGQYWLVISDIMLPGMDGLAFLERLNRINDSIPAIIVTGNPSFDFALKALHVGASGFLVKPIKQQEFSRNIKKVANIVRKMRDRKPALRHTLEEDREMVFDTLSLMEVDNLLVTANHLSEQFGAKEDRGKTVRVQYALAIHEALRNAVEHGNLELSSDLKEDDMFGSFGEKYDQALKERLADPKHASRKVYVKFTRRPDRMELSIRDEGPGFDHSKVLNAEQHLEVVPAENHGRGFMIIQAYMDEVSFSDKGNVITMARKVKLDE